MSIFLKFLGAALLVFGFVLGCYAAVFYVQQYRILRNWPRAEATVVDSRVVEHATEAGPLYTTEIRFAFSVAGKPVIGNYVFPHASAHREAKEKQVAQYTIGSRHDILYDPGDPSSVRVRPGYNVEFFVVPVFVAGVAAIFTVVGVGLWLIGRVTARRTLRAPA